jgi:hypothetical protein
MTGENLPPVIHQKNILKLKSLDTVPLFIDCLGGNFQNDNYEDEEKILP